MRASMAPRKIMHPNLIYSLIIVVMWTTVLRPGIEGPLSSTILEFLYFVSRIQIYICPSHLVVQVLVWISGIKEQRTVPITPSSSFFFFQNLLYTPMILPSYL
ncbi:hypothetical protein NC652_017861 [Populus alba x Populus x berolinensis]|nr:hypothetical protein NC652_017861 [Populus alba x Populus x berolinensis]